MTMTMNSTLAALVIEPDGTARMTEAETDLRSMQLLVGGLIEALRPTTFGYGSWVALVNEEGKHYHLPLNVAGTTFAQSVGWAGREVLRGPVVFLGASVSGEETDVPPEVVGAAVRVWGLDDAAINP